MYLALRHMICICSYSNFLLSFLVLHCRHCSSWFMRYLAHSTYNSLQGSNIHRGGRIHWLPERHPSSGGVSGHQPAEERRSVSLNPGLGKDRLSWCFRTNCGGGRGERLTCLERKCKLLVKSADLVSFVFNPSHSWSYIYSLEQLLLK